MVEDAILTTWDIIHEPFDWMACWGSLVYVPFCYPLATVWLPNNPYTLPGRAVAGILCIGLAAGTHTLFGYGYFLAFVIFLVHRDWRDDRHCAAEYGDDGKAYRQQVRWHILPGVY